jgi:dienelactone hydrolase
MQWKIQNRKNQSQEEAMRSRFAFSLVALCIIAYFSTLVLFAKIACAQVAKTEICPLQTMTLTDEQFLTGAKDGKPTLVAGELRIPRMGEDRLPAVVLVHGSGGVVANVDGWSQELNKIGVATFILDSFTGRGMVDTRTSQKQLGRLTVINDTYRVLELLARHPRIDPLRIGLMGFSRGGFAVLYASLKRFKRVYAPSNVEFAAYVAFYPVCNFTFIDDGEVSDQPIRLFHGSTDDFVPVGPCREYVNRLQKAGKDIQLTEYPDTYHNFDNPVYKVSSRLPQAQTVRSCRMEENPVGRIINTETKQPFSMADTCVERGVTVAYNSQAHSEALKAVKEFFTAMFKLR